jgi:3-methylornithyl-N6-L-lysine dehydrogenase
VTRLVEADVRTLTARLTGVEKNLKKATGLDLVGIAARACGVGEGVARDALANASSAVVPISSGQGVISGFVECVAAICRHIGCATRVTGRTDVGGFADALGSGSTLVFAADDERFLALNAKRGWMADNDPCTAHAYVAALDAAAGGVAGKPVLVIGLGPVGRAAAARLVELGAELFACETDQKRLAEAAAELPLTAVTLSEGLAHCWLVLDATPAIELIDIGWVWSDCVVSAPGLPSGVTLAARETLGERLIHEPLALGVATMAVHALVGPRD